MEPGPICAHDVASHVAQRAVCTGLLSQKGHARPNLLTSRRRVQCEWGPS